MNESLTGTYTIVLTPETSTGSLTATTAQFSDVTKTLTLGTRATVEISNKGQTGLLTFTAPAGSGFSWSADSAFIANYEIQDPDQFTIANGQLPAGKSSGTIPLWFPLSPGKYTMRLTPSAAQTGTIKITMSVAP
jgi:hypothetical protein